MTDKTRGRKKEYPVNPRVSHADTPANATCYTHPWFVAHSKEEYLKHMRKEKHTNTQLIYANAWLTIDRNNLINTEILGKNRGQIVKEVHDKPIKKKKKADRKYNDFMQSFESKYGTEN